MNYVEPYDLQDKMITELNYYFNEVAFFFLIGGWSGYKGI